MDMTTQELKKLAKKFDRFFEPESDSPAEDQMRQFWFGLFGCNNSEREVELLEYWRKTF